MKLLILTFVSALLALPSLATAAEGAHGYFVAAEYMKASAQMVGRHPASIQKKKKSKKIGKKKSKKKSRKKLA